MRLRSILASASIPFFLLAVTASAHHAPTDLSIARFAAKSVTVGWTATPDVTGYGLYVDGKRVATAGASATQAKFGTPEYRRYVVGVLALKSGGAMSTITVEPRWISVSVNIPEEPSPPNQSTVPASINSTCATDVSAALQSWINSRPDGSTLLFPNDSCYRVEAGIGLSGRSNITLSGVGATLRASSVGDGHRSMIRFTNGSNHTVRGFRLEGGYTTPGTHNGNVQWAHGVDVLGTQTVLVEDVTVVNVGGDCVYLGLGSSRSRDVTVRRLTCTGTGRNGVSFVATDRAHVSQSSTQTIGYIPFDVEPNSGAGFGVDTATITGNTIGNYVINAFTIVGEAPVANITFSSNQITASLGGRIQVTGTSRRQGVTISGNTATQILSYPQVVRLDNVDGAVVTNNTIPTTGVMLRCASVTGLTFSGNTPGSSAGC